jgi:hypothetical protein
MSIAQLVIFALTNLLLLAALVGLVWRRRVHLAYAFPAYLLAIIVLSSLVALWPARLHTWSFYWVKESVYSVLKVAVALELVVRVFRAFPAAGRAARVVFLMVLATTVVAAWSATPPSPGAGRSQADWAHLVLSLHPRITNGTAWLFGALFALILYYRLPLHPLHKAIAFGFMAYLLLLTFGLDQVRRTDFAARPLVSYASSLGYAAAAAYWARAAWRRDPPPPVDPEVVDRLQPWRREGASPDL